MELRRIDSLPPYVFATIRDLTLELRRSGVDVVDLGFGNPDLPSPEVAVAKLQEAAALCDRIVIIAKGQVVASGTADELRAQTGESNLEDAFVKAIGSEEGLHA